MAMVDTQIISIGANISGNIDALDQDRPLLPQNMLSQLGSTSRLSHFACSSKTAVPSFVWRHRGSHRLDRVAEQAD